MKPVEVGLGFAIARLGGSFNVEDGVGFQVAKEWSKRKSVWLTDHRARRWQGQEARAVYVMGRWSLIVREQLLLAPWVYCATCADECVCTMRRRRRLCGDKGERWGSKGRNKVVGGECDG